MDSCDFSSMNIKLEMLIKKRNFSQCLYDKSICKINDIDSQIQEINDRTYNDEKEYISKENRDLIKRLVYFNIIPCLSIGFMLLISGQSEFIFNMGGFALNLTGIPTTLICLGIYLKNKKSIIDKFSRDYRRSKEYMDLYEKLFSLQKEKNSLQESANLHKELIESFNKEINYYNNRINYANSVANIIESELDNTLDNLEDDEMVKRLK